MPAFIVVGLGWGDEGKGTVTDFLVRSHGAHEVVRFNGGAQAAHNVVLPDGRHHTFRQFGSGTFVPGVETYLSKHMLVNPHELFIENEALKKQGVTDAIQRLSIDADALITTPWHVAANRLREWARGGGRHGSCGMGIGETMQDALDGIDLRARDLHDPKTLQHKLIEIRAHKIDQMKGIIQNLPGAWAHHLAHDLVSFSKISESMEIYRILAKLVPMYQDRFFTEDRTYVFEGAQGVLLDEWYGFHPHTTWSDTTTGNALDLLDGFDDEIRSIGVIRSYHTRHGAGPFPTELSNLPDKAPYDFPEAHNGHGQWQGSWRTGALDLPMLRYAVEACPVDELAMTHADVVKTAHPICTNYSIGDPIVPSKKLDRKTWEVNRAFALSDLLSAIPRWTTLERGERMEDILDLQVDLPPVTIVSSGPTHEDKTMKVSA